MTFDRVDDAFRGTKTWRSMNYMPPPSRALKFVLFAWVFIGTLGIFMPKPFWGPWGDGFGSLNTLFTGLGFIGILATLAHQKEEVQEAKKDLNDVLAALGKTAAAMEKTARIAAIAAALEQDRDDIKAIHGGGAFTRNLDTFEPISPTDMEALKVRYKENTKKLREAIEST